MTEKDTFSFVIKKIGRIYRNILRRVGSFLAFILGSVAAAGLIVLPIWYFAKNHHTGYTVFVGIVLAGTLLFLLIRRLLRQRADTEESGGFRFLRFLWQFFSVLLFIGWVYAIVIVVLRGMTGTAVILGLALVIAFGFFLYGKNK